MYCVIITGIRVFYGGAGVSYNCFSTQMYNEHSATTVLHTRYCSNAVYHKTTKQGQSVCISSVLRSVLNIHTQNIKVIPESWDMFSVYPPKTVHKTFRIDSLDNAIKMIQRKKKKNNAKHVQYTDTEGQLCQTCNK